MRISYSVLLLSGLVLGACGDDAPPPGPPVASVEQVLPNIPFPPNPTPVATEKTDDAMQMVLASAVPADSVVGYYRTIFAAAPYRLINESKNGNVTSFYVEQDGPSMWVTVQPIDSLSARVTIAGARGALSRPRDPANPDPVGASGEALPRPVGVPIPGQP